MTAAKRIYELVKALPADRLLAAEPATAQTAGQFEQIFLEVPQEHQEQG